MLSYTIYDLYSFSILVQFSFYIWLAEDTLDNLLDQVADLQYRLLKANELARKNLEKSPQKQRPGMIEKPEREDLG